MKKRTIIILIIAVSLLGVAFTPILSLFTPIGSPKLWLEVLGGIKVDSAFQLPLNYNPSYTNVDSARRVWYNSTTNSLWWNDGTKRRQIIDSPGVSALYIGEPITGPWASNAVLFVSLVGQLGNDTFFQYSSSNHLYVFRTSNGDTVFAGGYDGANSYAGVYLPRLIIGKSGMVDSIDVSLMTTGRRQYAQDKNGTFAYLDDVPTVVARTALHTTTLNLVDEALYVNTQDVRDTVYLIDAGNFLNGYTNRAHKAYIKRKDKTIGHTLIIKSLAGQNIDGLTYLSIDTMQSIEISTDDGSQWYILSNKK